MSLTTRRRFEGFPRDAPLGIVGARLGAEEHVAVSIKAIKHAEENHTN